MRRFTIRNGCCRNVFFVDSKQASSNQFRSSKALAVMDNIEMFHNKTTVAAEAVGVRFEADLVKSVPISMGVGCHLQKQYFPP